MVGKMSKKRPASSQAGSAPKKPHLEKSYRKPEPSELSDALGKGKKRSRPVTAPVKDDSATDEEGMDDFDDLDEGETLEVDGNEGDDMLVDAPVQTKDPKASREAHRAQRVLLNERKAAKPHSALLGNAKRLWSLARQKNIPKAEREKHIRALMDVVRGKVQEVVLKHDASRIVQTIVKHGGQKERDEIAAELKGKYLALAQNKYSKFLVTKLIRSCPAHRRSILLEFNTHVIRLLLHRESSSVIADAYELYANARERSLLLRDFYGKEVALFSSGTANGADADEEQKAEIKKGLKGVLADADAQRRRRILSALKENLDLIFNNPEKGAVSHAIVHHAIWEYLTEVNGLDDEVERDKLRRDAFEGCQELIAEMVHTKDGSRVVREFIAQGTAKDRKQILKVLKPHIERICKDDEAQLVLFTALDVIDDTKLTSKSLVSEVVSRAPSLYKSPQGRRSLLYLIIPRSPRHFTVAQITTLAETDPIRARTSKKDDAVRRDEVRMAASEGLIAMLADESKAEEIVRDTGGSLVVGEVMLYADGSKEHAINGLLAPLSAPYPSADEAKPHLIDVPHTSRVYKTLLQGGHFSQQSKSVSRAPSFSPSAFASAWMKTVGKDNTVTMAQGSGAFVVAALCERLKEEGSDEEKAELRRWLEKDVRTAITAGQVKGKEVLLKSLDALDT